MKTKLIVAAIAVVIALVVYQRIQARKKFEQPFRDQLATWNQINYPAGPFTVPKGEVLFRTGKVFAMIESVGPPTDVGFGYLPPDINEAWDQLDPSIRAMRPEEVETLVITSRGSLAGTGTVLSAPKGDGPVRWQTSLQVYRGPQISFRVYDLKTQTLIGAAAVEIPDIGKHAKPLARFIEAMPVR